MQIAASGALLQGRHSTAVRGRLTARTAIARLVSGSGIEAQIVGETVILRKAAKKAPAKRDTAAREPAAIAVADEEPIRAEDIVVSGYRASLLKAEQLKKKAIGTRETILAEDIAEFPEQNLADALQRIPGITITREGGEGRQIQMRGLGPEFTQVTLNGMEALGTTSSAMDSRGSVSRTRAFDYNIFASELFSRVDVHKTYSADLDEGGLAGTIALRTPRPFDYSSDKAVISAQLQHNENADDTLGKRFAGLFSKRLGDFGILASFAYSRRDVSETGYDTVRWRQVDAQGGDISALPSDVQDLINDKQLWFARGARPIIFNSDTERLGGTLALQWQASDNLRFGIDALYGELNAKRSEYHIQLNTGSSTGLGCYTLHGVETCTKITDLQYAGANQVTYLALEDTKVASESRIETARSKISQVVFHGDWQVDDRLNFKALAGHEGTEFKDNSAKVYMVVPNVDATLDFRNGFTGYNTYSSNVLDPGSHYYADIDLWQPEIKNDFDVAKFDASYDLDSHHNLSAGVSYKKYRNEYWVAENENINKTGFNDGTIDDTVDPNLTFVTCATGSCWLATDIQGVLDKYGIQRELDQISEDKRTIVIEQTKAAYLQYTFRDIGLPLGSLRGNLGLRYYDTKITSKGIANDVPVSIDKYYDGFLPTLNLAWDVTDAFVMRASASKNITRVALGALGVSGRINNNPTVLTISAGNPDLRPMKSTNLDLSGEYYFKEGGYISVSLFYKRVTDMIGSETFDIRYGDSGYPLSWLDGALDEYGNPQTADTIYSYLGQVNLSKSTIKGFEVGFKHDFDFLPGPLENLGLIANYTYADGQTLYPDVQGTGISEYKSFPGLSEHTANVTLYYETDRWGARVSGAYRSDWILSVQAGNTDEDERGFHGSTFIDFSSHYNVNKRLKLAFDILNVTDEPIEQYSDTDDRLYGTTTSGRTFTLKATYSF
ncbi:TonB-dependent receptor [Novosphingobium sp. HK4-1]|uniref:TonB-dependent receptor n=1 Tax=Novosphingobium mangrovi (ex Huang et al. 2023) TaxID=2976432 RepID=A0ABT2I8R2_9SPHN|nr:TonB-dependent receptor [Novosphingobium mangrovi (ex Huang et al. 2023)]